MTEAIKQAEALATEDERSLPRGCLEPQYQTRENKDGVTKTYGPYYSLVLSITDDQQAWFYLGKPGTDRYNTRLEIARDIMGVMARAGNSNTEIALRLEDVLKNGRSSE